MKNPKKFNEISTLIRQAYNNPDIIEEVKKKVKDPNLSDEENYTILHKAVLVGVKELVIYFLELGADINIKDDSGYTPISLAENCVRNSNDSKPNWATWQASKEDKIEILEILKNSNISVNPPSKEDKIEILEIPKNSNKSVKPQRKKWWHF